MIPSLHNGISALKSLSQGLQVLGNNIANVNSLGYKSSRANYSDNFYLHMNDAEAGPDGQPSNNILQHGTGAHVSSISSNFNQGTIETTGLDLDLAIQGEALPNGGGFFEVIDTETDELFYTRAGAFEADINGNLVTRDQYRYRLRGMNGEVSVALEDPDHTLLARRIEENGEINMVVHDSKNNKDIVTPTDPDQKEVIKVVNFLSPQNLRRVGNGFYSNGRAGQDLAGISGGRPAEGSSGKIKQYALEMSNVDLTNEFASMISHQRSFQAGSRVVTTSDAILSEAVNLKR